MHGATVALALKAVFDGNFDAFGGRSDRLGVISADPAENAVQLAASTQFGDGFTAEDYAALRASHTEDIRFLMEAIIREIEAQYASIRLEANEGVVTNTLWYGLRARVDAVMKTEKGKCSRIRL